MAQNDTSSPESCFETLDDQQLASVNGGYSAAMFDAMLAAIDHGLTINSTVTGKHSKNSNHYKGRAFDTRGSQRAMNSFYGWASRNTRYHELIFRNHFLKDGRRRRGIGGHNNHVHFSI